MMWDILVLLAMGVFWIMVFTALIAILVLATSILTHMAGSIVQAICALRGKEAPLWTYTIDDIL